MVLLDNDGFLFELNKLFVRSKNSGNGSVVITCKKLPAPHETRAQKKRREEAGESLTGEKAVLFRATLNKKKISTTVNGEQLEKFQGVYATMLRSNMDSLKKKEKKRRAQPRE
eukprot:m.337949 g.337949  ORF g.337949 m.337949 type:complete len:113 (+) comp18274_c0_seq1:145-483(+)